MTRRGPRLGLVRPPEGVAAGRHRPAGHRLGGRRGRGRRRRSAGATAAVTRLRAGQRQGRTGAPADLDADVAADCVVIGCDSMLYFDGALCGKPATAEAARSQWQSMAGRAGELHTGHCVLRLRDGVTIGRSKSKALAPQCISARRPTTSWRPTSAAANRSRRGRLHARRARRLVRRPDRRRPVERHRHQPAADAAAAGAVGLSVAELWPG